MYGDHSKFSETYMTAFPGYYFTGDRAFRDSNGYYWILGRADDVLNVSGHRLSTAEIEAAICHSGLCVEAAALGKPHDITGQAIWVFCVAQKQQEQAEKSIKEMLKNEVKKSIGAFATPTEIILVEDLPKTRSGKVMRRILRKMLEGLPKNLLGDLSTLNDPKVIDDVFIKLKPVLDLQGLPRS